MLGLFIRFQTECLRYCNCSDLAFTEGILARDDEAWFSKIQ
jgi:hypothetical protein